MTFLVKIKGYLEAFGAFLLAIGGAFLYGHVKGKDTGESDIKQADAKATAQAVQKQTAIRAEVDSHVDALPVPKQAPISITVPPAASVQNIGSAEPGTAARQLQDDWTSKT